MGREVEQAGQRFVWMGDRLHARADGTVGWLDEWGSRCAECGAYFVTTTPRGADKLKLTRRCREHARKGFRVRARKSGCRWN